MQTLKQVAKAHRFAAMQPTAVQARNDERHALRAAIDEATTDNELSAREIRMLGALHSIVLETMNYRPHWAGAPQGDSYLPADMVAHAQECLRAYGCNVEPEVQQ